MIGRHDPGAEPRAVSPRQRRECIPVIPETPIDDRPAIARTIGVSTEASRAYADSVALDPAHGIAQHAAIESARTREARLAQLIADAQRDGATTPAAIAAHLTRMGVAVRA